MRFSGVWLPVITPFKDGEVVNDSSGNTAQSLDLLRILASAECRLPRTRVSDALARDLDRLIPAASVG